MKGKTRKDFVTTGKNCLSKCHLDFQQESVIISAMSRFWWVHVNELDFNFNNQTCVHERWTTGNSPCALLTFMHTQNRAGLSEDTPVCVPVTRSIRCGSVLGCGPKAATLLQLTLINSVEMSRRLKPRLRGAVLCGLCHSSIGWSTELILLRYILLESSIKHWYKNKIELLKQSILSMSLYLKESWCTTDFWERGWVQRSDPALG